MERQNASRTRSADVMEKHTFWWIRYLGMIFPADVDVSGDWRLDVVSCSSVLELRRWMHMKDRRPRWPWRTEEYCSWTELWGFQGLGPERAVCCNLSVTGRLTVTRLLNTIFTSTILWLISHIYWRQADSVFHFSSVDMLWKCSRSRPFDWNDIMFYLLKKQNYLWSQSR